MFNWNDFMNDFPYTNFSDINVSWFLNKFKQVFDEWEGLYNQMLSWKTATDEYNATWRAQQEQAFTTWENNFQSAIDAWKVQTETDISTWETDTIATLEAWKAVFINQYNALKAEVEQIAEDAETAKNSAQASATSAQQSADSASATALALQASLQQISTNTGDISDLKTQLAFDRERESWILLNGIDYSKFINGKYYTQNGNLANSESYSYSEDYIPIKPNTTYAWAYLNNESWESFAAIAFCIYDENKTFIGQYYDLRYFESPNNAYYVRISIRIIYSNYVMFYETETIPELPSKYSAFGYIMKAVKDNQDDISDIQEEISDIENIIDNYTDIDEFPNRFNKNDIINGAYFARNGNLVNDSNWSYSPTYSTVEPSTIYYSRYNNDGIWTSAVVAVAWYDSSKNFISQMHETSTMTSPSNAAFVRISYKHSIVNETLVFATFEATSEIPYGVEYKLNEQVKLPQIKDNILYEKILCCCGDSITYGADMDAEGISDSSPIIVYQSSDTGIFSEVTSNFLKSYGYQIAERNKMTFYNAGVSGSTMQGIADKNGFSIVNGRYTKLPNNIDYLTIWFGWNDAAYGTLGTITDETNESYYGGYNIVLPYLINKYPNTKIGLIVPFGSTEGHRNAIRNLGNKWGVGVFDNYGAQTPLYYGKETSVGVDATIVTKRRETWQANGAHPNYKGHYQLSTQIEAWLRTL